MSSRIARRSSAPAIIITTSDDDMKSRRGLAALFFRGSRRVQAEQHKLLSASSCSAAVDPLTKLHNDDTLTASVSSSASDFTRWMSDDSERSPEQDSMTPSRKGCLKHRTQIDSLRHVYKTAATADTITNSTNEEDTTKQRAAPVVQFGSVQVHSHGIILGDSPAVSQGPPVTVEWESFDSIDMTVDDFENAKRGPDRRGPELILPRRLREDMIQRSGLSSRQEIAQTIRTTSSIRQSRQRTAQRAVMGDRWRSRLARVTMHSSRHHGYHHG